MCSAPAGSFMILGGNRGQRDPIAQSLNRFIMTLRDFGFDVGVIVSRCGAIVETLRRKREQ